MKPVSRVVKPQIITDIDAIATKFPQPSIQAAVIEAYLRTAGSIFVEA